MVDDLRRNFIMNPQNGLKVMLCAIYLAYLFTALTLLVGWQEGHLAWKKTDRWGAGVVICMERGADLHMAQLMPLPLTVSCFSKIQIGLTFLVPAHPGSPGKGAVKQVCVCVLFTANESIFAKIVATTVKLYSLRIRFEVLGWNYSSLASVAQSSPVDYFGVGTIWHSH